MRNEHGIKDGENWDETMFNVFDLKAARSSTSGAANSLGRRRNPEGIIDPVTP
jgi:hypothetical protein